MTLRSIALKTAAAGALLLMGTAASLAASAQATSSVNVRSGPGTQYGVVDQLYAGEDVDVLGCRGGWCEVDHSGPDGWVSASYLGRGYADDSFYDDDYYDGPDYVIRAPRAYRSYRSYPYYYRNYPRGPYASFCFGGGNARFCVND